MTPSDVIHIEDIRHDPLLGLLTGTVIRRIAGGSLTREEICEPSDHPGLPHSDAEAKLRRAAARL